MHVKCGTRIDRTVRIASLDVSGYDAVYVPIIITIVVTWASEAVVSDQPRQNRGV
jgi:hypothetical protein